jgi:predicted nucleotidyltransferase
MDRQTILEYLKLQKPALERKYKMTGIGLFGSFARNEQDEESDIDIVYSMAEGERLSYFQVIELENQLKSYLKREVELVNFKYLNPIIKYKAEKEIVYV